MLAQLREDELAAVIHNRVMAALVERLDSSHVLSDMATLRRGRTKMMGVSVRRLLHQVRRLFGGAKRDAEMRRTQRQSVASEMYEPGQRFAAHPKIAQTKAYRGMCAIFREQCEVAGEKVTVREKIGGAVIQNPSDTGATYDGHKGAGYKVQVCETCHEDNEVQLITLAMPQTAADTDPESVPAVVERPRRDGLVPSELLADSAYGSDGNVQV